MDHPRDQPQERRGNAVKGLFYASSRENAMLSGFFLNLYDGIKFQPYRHPWQLFARAY